MCTQRQQTYVWHLKKAKQILFSFPDHFVKLNCNENQVAECGQDSLLECVLKTSDDVTNLKIQYVTWKRYSGDGSDPDVVLELIEGKPNSSEGYSFAEPNWNSTYRNVSLLITNAAVQHVGFYECEVATNSGDPRLSKMISFNVTGKLLPQHHFFGRCVCVCVIVVIVW